MAGIMPLVPGLSLYRGFVGLVTTRYLDGLTGLITASGTALALAAGVILAPAHPTARRDLHALRRRKAVPLLVDAQPHQHAP